MIEHLLPGIIKLPITGVCEKPLLGQQDRLLGGRVDAGRALVVRRSGLAFFLGALAGLKIEKKKMLKLLSRRFDHFYVIKNKLSCQKMLNIINN